VTGTGGASRQYVIERDVPVTMSDGVVLRADVWRPADATIRTPTLLQRTPYDKSAAFGTQTILGLEITRALDAGFSVVIQDTRGRYASDGDFEAFTQEASDGEDTVSWVLDQAFNDGDVMSYGASYVGATQMLTASARPAGLRAVAPNLTTSQYHEGWTYRGGALQLGFVHLWMIEALAGPDLVRPSRVGDIASAELLGRLLADPVASMSELPLLRAELEQLLPSYAAWLRHPTRDEYWRDIDPSREYGGMDVAGLHIAGWNDIFLDDGLRNYAGMVASSGTEWARSHQYLVVGPWSHGNISAWQGEGWHGYAAEAAVLDLTAVHLEFFSAVSQHREPELPKVKVFVSGSDEWQTFDQWPPSPVRVEEWALDAGGGGLLLAPGGTQPAVGELTFDADPANPVPTVGGASFLPGLTMGRNSGPRDQALVEARDDVLVLTSDALADDLTVTGEVVLRLTATSSAVDCDWTARLTDVDPAGRSIGLVDGIVRARYRKGPDDGGSTAAAALAPGVREDFTVVLGSIAHRFRAGHRVRLQVASSNFPRFDRNPQSLVDPVTATVEDFVVAHQTVHTGSGTSTLLLPVLRRPASESR
jgi:putative CocE/NonD family hydrolase